MDAVITYVDGNDPLWQRDYQTVTRRASSGRRYRDWGTLPYLLRGIQRHCSFVENTFLVVARESQVPAWLNRETVRVVLHADIIPAGFLPTFNSTAIELFLHRIPGLSEQYLYFNDDTFPVADLSADDFFPEGRPRIGFSRHLFAGGLYRQQTRNAWRTARAALTLPQRPGFRRPQHTCSPMLRSVCEDLFTRQEPQLLASVTPLRAACNINQYVFSDYALLSGRALPRRLSNRHIPLGAATPSRLAAAVLSPDRKILCLNDTEMPPERFVRMREALLAAFAVHFPEKSRFER